MDFHELGSKIIEEYKDVFSRIDDRMIDAFIHEITTHERLFFIGVGREGMMTRAFAMRMTHMGKEVHWIWDDTTPGIGEGDLLIATIGSGEIGHIRYVCERAKEHGARIVIITGSPSGNAVKLADFVLFIPGQVYGGTDDVAPSVQPMGNLFEQSLLIVLDMICIKMVDENPDITYEKMEKRHRNVE